MDCKFPIFSSQDVLMFRHEGVRPCFVTKVAAPLSGGLCLEVCYLDNVKHKPVLSGAALSKRHD